LLMYKMRMGTPWKKVNEKAADFQSLRAATPPEPNGR
jgi:hypothetical protein